MRDSEFVIFAFAIFKRIQICCISIFACMLPIHTVISAIVYDEISILHIYIVDGRGSVPDRGRGFFL
jgi:hypothetical protein